MAVKTHAPTDSDRNFFKKADELAKQAEPLPWYKSIPAAALKGLVEGTVGLGRAMSGSLGIDEQTDENRKILLDKYLPSNTGIAENIAEKSASAFPMLTTGGFGAGGAALRGTAAAASSEAAKELGFGETVQAIAELPALLGPDLARKIPVKAGSNQERLAQSVRAQGVPEEDLALMLGSQGKVKESLSNIAPKGGGTKKAFDSAKESLNKMWQGIKNSPEAKTPLAKDDANQLFNEIAKKASDMPSEQRARFTQDFLDLLGTPMAGEDIINFWQKLNYYIPKGEKGLGVLKEDLSQALKKISPELGEEFSIMNELYGNYSRLRDQMEPSIVDKFFRAGEFGALAAATISMDVPTLTGVIGAVAARELARQAIINPRLQNLSQRFLNASKRSSPRIAQIAYDQLVVEIAKTDAETAAKLSEFDAEEFTRALSSDKNKNDKAH